jgi:amino acid adenylation domain-containing protein
VSAAHDRDWVGLSRAEKLALLACPERRPGRAGCSFPLSSAQQRMWFLDRLDPGNPANNIFRALTFRGRLDLPALSRALSEIARRHEALRTVFPLAGDEPRQRVEPAARALPLPLVDLAALPAPVRRPVAAELARRASRRGFDLARGPLFRAALLRLGTPENPEHALFLELHHIVADGWSMGLLFAELATLYGAFTGGRPSPLPEPVLQYPEVAARERERLAGLRLAAELAWWRARLAGIPTVLELPTDHRRPAVESLRGDLARFFVPQEVAGGLKALGRQGGATLFMTLLAAFEVLLNRYTGQDRFLVGTTVAGRHRPELEKVFGLFANTLVLPAELAGRATFRQLLAAVRRSTLEAYGHQELPFERLVEALHPERQLAHNPLVQVLIALQNQPPEEIALPGLAVGTMAAERGLAKLDLTLDLTETGAEIDGYLEFSTDLFEFATAARMAEHLLQLLSGILADPEREIADLPLLSTAERQRILYGWNPAGYSLRPPVPGLIAAQARRTPEAPAVLAGGASLTYAELDERAGRLARHLRRRGVGPDTLVGLCLERSLTMAVALLGVLKAGAAYVPLDPDYPRERLALMIADTLMPVLLTESHLAANLPPCAAQILFLDRQDGWSEGEEGSDEDREILAEGLAYVVYTSGSTGRPKGVGVPHRALANHATECVRRYGLTPADRVLQFTSLSFDITSEEVFPTWIAGGAVVLRPPGIFPSLAELEALLERQGVTVVNLPTAYWHEWASELHRQSRRPPAALRLAIVGTEQALPERLAEWLEVAGDAGGGARFANSYASTECTVTALVHIAGPEALARARAGQRVPVGTPIDNCRVYVLDARMEPVPIGVPGDIYIGGANVARGYLGDPERTAVSFLPDPFATCGPGGRLYRQGDRGRFLPNGELLCLGRSDDLVKVRGYRVEPGEIEAVLARHPAVRGCAVLVRDGELVAYVAAVPAAADLHPTPAELAAHLARSLPAYMVPAELAVLPDLPWNANGKVDRRALERRAPGRPATAEGAGGGAPRSPLEEVVLELWSQVLGRERLGIRDNFFDLGGHSLLAARVIARVREALGVELPLRALFEQPTVAGLAAAAEAARRSTAAGEAGGLAAPPIEPLSSGRQGPLPWSLGEQGPLPCSFAQQRLWVIDQLTPGSPAYNLSDLLAWRGPLNRAALARALSEVVRRHEVLRTTFGVHLGQAVQVIAPPAPLPLPVIDLAGLPGAMLAGEEAGRRAAAAGRQPFDLGRGPLFRAALYRLGETDHLLFLSLHHIVSDGASLRILLGELLALYGAGVAGVQGAPSPLPELPVQYADYAAWQRGWLAGPVLAAQLAYWREALAGAPPVLDLPTDRPRPAVEETAGARRPFTLPPDLARGLAAVGRRGGATRFMTLLAGFDALLARWAGTDDVVVGWPIAGRGRAEVEGIIGFLANVLVARVRIAEGASFAQLLGQVRATALDAYTHGDLPFEVLVEDLRPERHLSHNPVFQVFFALHQDDGLAATLGSLPGVDLDLPGLAAGTSLLDLSLAVIEGGERSEQGALPAFLEYKTALFDAATVERMAGHLLTLLAGAAAAPEVPLAALPILSAAERQQLAEADDTVAALPAGATAHSLFAARAAAAPEAIAVEHLGEQLSYGELAARAGRLARRLRRLGIGPGDRVGICLERSATLVTALLGVLAAGGAYVPLDPTHPAERLRFLLADADLRLLMTESALAGGLPTYDLPELAVLDLDALDAAADPSGADAALPDVSGEDLAYILYTSGSTGQPKGVEVRHGGLANFLLSLAGRPGLTAADALLAVTTLAFDIAGLEIYLPLAVGARIVLAGRAAAADGKRLAAHLRDSGATVMQATPATWRLLLAAGWTGQPGLTALCGGEALPAELARQLLPRVGALWNLYGPTETTIWSALGPVAGVSSGAVPIGRPIANTSLHLLDRRLQPVPAGVVGEVYIGGEGLARGYLRRPALTAERFLPDPWADPRENGARLYRTGDLARRLPAGEIEFLGRADHQVKVRGFRVEPGEIEAALGRHPAVAQAVVVLREGDLVAYVVAAEPAVANVGAGNLRAALREELPEYMVPSRFVFLPELPRTPNGKIDRKALPPPGADPIGPGREPLPPVAPRTPVERRVAEVWAAVLGVARVGVCDNFFELGGHSLSATQVIARLEAGFGLELGLPAIFRAPTVAGLAEAIIERGLAPADGELLAEIRPAAPRPAIPRASRSLGPFPLSFAQQRLWFLDQYEPESPEHNVPQGFRLTGSLSPAGLCRALQAIVDRHEALRTTFLAAGGEPRQVIAPHLPVALPEIDVSGLPAEAREAVARRAARADARRTFDLTSGPLFRALLFRLDTAGSGEHLFFLNVHHIAYDIWSRGVLLGELAALYSGTALPELPVQYLDFALWQRGWLEGAVLARQLAYWREQLAGAPPLGLPTDRPRPPLRTTNGATESALLPAQLVAALSRLGQEAGGTLYVSLAALLKLLLARATGQEDLTVGTLIAGRTRPELEPLIGFFANTLALRGDLSGDPSFAALLRREREVVLGAYAHQDLPFERLVAELRPARDLARTPIFQVMVNLLNAPGGPLALPGLEVAELPVDSATARFELTLYLAPQPEGLVAYLEYNADLFDAATIRRFLDVFRILAEGAIADPELPLSRLPCLAAGEVLQLTSWSAMAARALPPPARSARAADLPWVEPRSLAEAALADVFAAVLGVERVGVDDDFFDLGGDSLTAVRAVAQANRRGLGITLRQLFARRTAAELAEVLGRAEPPAV